MGAPNGEGMALGAVGVAPAPLRMSRLGKYDVVAKLGQGGMAQVYLGVSRAEIKDFRKLVVLKVLHDNLRDDPKFVEMFMKEAAIAARLAHPNVVHTYTVGEEDGHHCIVMEYLEGASLNSYIKRLGDSTFEGRVPLLGAVSKALAGLHYVHEFTDYDGTRLDLVHRDVKPGNIFITFDGQVKLLDFGVAKMTATDQATASQVVKGTVHYMAPEALDTSHVHDRRLDVFAVGLTLWEVANGRRFWGELSNLQILKSLAESKLPGCEREEGVPLEITQICERALAPDPETRYQNALELKRDLDQYLRGIGYEDESLSALSDQLFSELRERRAKAIKDRLALVQQVGSDARPLSGSLPTLTGMNAAAPVFTDNTSPSTTVARSAASAVFLAVGGAIVGVGVFAVLLFTHVIGPKADDNGPEVASNARLDAEVDTRSPDEGFKATQAIPPDIEDGSTNDPPAASPTLNTAVDDAVPPDSVERVVVTVAVVPENASLTIDGEPVKNPTEIRSVVGRTFTLVADADGYRQETLEIETDRTKELAIRLEKRKPSPRPRRHSSPSKPTSSSEKTSGATDVHDKPAAVAATPEEPASDPVLRLGGKPTKRKKSALDVDPSNPFRNE